MYDEYLIYFYSVKLLIVNDCHEFYGITIFFLLGTLWNILKKVGIEKDKPHSVFGDVKKLIMQEFSRQM